MIEEILSPDLRLARRQEDAQARRLAAVPQFALGDLVKAGATGKPGVLEAISPAGFAQIRWSCGSCLCGVPVDDLHHS